MKSFAVAAAVVMFLPPAAARLPVDTLRPTGSLPSRLVASIESPRAFVETSTGVSLVLDGDRQAVHAIDVRKGTSRRIVEVGSEDGHIMGPSGFSLGPNDIFAITDQPGQYPRLQYFDEAGRLINRVWLAEGPAVRMALGRVAIRSAGALAFTGRTFLINAPGAGALMNEYDANAQPVRSVGALRATGHETDPALHAALNTGLPLVDPTGGYYFVFDSGTPMFRKYDRDGRLVYERHVEGLEVDAPIRALPRQWPARDGSSGAAPFVPGVIDAAAVDSHGRLWVSVRTGFTYVYDRGDKVRVVQLDASGVLFPSSLFFTRDDRLLVTPGCYEFSSK